MSVDRLRQLRKAAGMTQTELADAVGVHQTMISQIERGERVIPKRRIGDFASALDVEEQTLREVVDDAGSSGGGDHSAGRMARSSEEINRWRNQLAVADLDPYARLLLSALPAFMDEQSALVVVTDEQLEQDANLPRQIIDDHLEELLHSPWIERIGRVRWVFRLVFPEQ